MPLLSLTVMWFVIVIDVCNALFVLMCVVDAVVVDVELMCVCCHRCCAVCVSAVEVCAV